MKSSKRRTNGNGVALLVEQLESRLLLSAGAGTSHLSITPATVAVPNGTTQQFTAVALDKSGHALAVQPKFTWKVSGSGTISSTGLFTAHGTGSVRVTASANGQSAVSNVKVTSPPAAVTHLKASAQNGQVSLSWTGSTGATSYDVYRGTSSGQEGKTPFATGVTALKFTDTSVTGGTTYFYKVTAVDSAGKSRTSAEVSATVPQAPAVPTGLALSAGQANVSLSWNAVSGAASYNIYRGTSSGGESLYKSVTGTSYNDTAVSALTTYYYQVSAVNSSGQSARSGEVSATPGADWFANNLPDPGLRSLARADFNRDGSITFADMQGLLTQAVTETGAGTVSAAVVASLKALASSSGAAYLGISPSVEGLAYNLADGGQTSYLGTLLNPLAANTTTATQLQELDNKWFLGEDLPTIDTQYWGTSGYALASGTLFGSSGVPKYTDIYQGEEGDCWLCASFAEIALKQPAIIQSSFTDDGLVSENGAPVHVWTYSYFNGGTREYVTVNNYFPSNNGVFMYLDAFQSMANTSNSLWAPLMEKAYAGIYGDSYASLNGGYAQNVLPMETGGTSGGDVFSTESTYISAIQSPTTLLTLASWSTNYGFVASHDYAVISVTGTGSTALFQLYNPWGTDQPPAITWAQLTQPGDFTQDGNTVVTAVGRLPGTQAPSGAALSAAGGFFANIGGASNFASDFDAQSRDDRLAAELGANATKPTADPPDLIGKPAGPISAGRLTGAKSDAGLRQFWASPDADLNSRFWDSL